MDWMNIGISLSLPCLAQKQRVRYYTVGPEQEEVYLAAVCCADGIPLKDVIHPSEHQQEKYRALYVLPFDLPSTE